MISRERIGIFGGTFDPVHTTHLAIARQVQHEANLDRVLFVVAAEPPHKRDEIEVPAALRLAMVEAALQDESGMEPCGLELNREGPSYTADTLAQLHELHPEAELFLIMGLDSLLDLPNWYQPQRILDLANILAVARPGYMDAVPEILAGQTQLITFDESTVSSTKLREQLRAGCPEENSIHPAVLALIQESGLYGY